MLKPVAGVAHWGVVVVGGGGVDGVVAGVLLELLMWSLLVLLI